MTHDLPQLVASIAAIVFLLAYLLSARARQRLRKKNKRLRKQLDQARNELHQARMVLSNLEQSYERAGLQAVRDRRELETLKGQDSVG